MGRVVNIIFAIVVASVPFWNITRMRDYVIFAVLLIAVSVIFNFKSRDFLPALFLLGLLGTLAAVSSLALELFLGGLGAALFYGYLNNRTNETYRTVFILCSAILLFIFIWAAAFFFTFTLPWYLVLVATFVLMMILFFQIRGNLLPALASSLIMVEVAWASLFLPVYFLTMAVAQFSVFYMVYMISNLYYTRTLTRDKILFQAGVMLAVLVLSFLSSAWQPV